MLFLDALCSDGDPPHGCLNDMFRKIYIILFQLLCTSHFPSWMILNTRLSSCQTVQRSDLRVKVCRLDKWSSHVCLVSLFTSNSGSTATRRPYLILGVRIVRFHSCISGWWHFAGRRHAAVYVGQGDVGVVMAMREASVLGGGREGAPQVTYQASQ